jgi:hypothetical protein
MCVRLETRDPGLETRDLQATQMSFLLAIMIGLLIIERRVEWQPTT